MQIRLFAIVALIAVATATASAQSVQWLAGDGGNGHWYEVVVSGPILWTDADAAAQAAGGHLATLSSQAENDFVFGLIDDDQYWNHVPDGFGPWIGGVQTPGAGEPLGTWSWVTGEPWGFMNWSVTQPDDGNDGQGNEDRLHFHSPDIDGRDNTWNDLDGIVNGWHDLLPVAYVIEYSCLCDLDDDGLVGVTDLLAVILGWGECPVEGCPADLNDNGEVDVSDLVAIILHWGPCPTP